MENNLPHSLFHPPPHGYIMAMGKNIRWRKGKGKAISFAYNINLLRLLKRISSAGTGEGDGNFVEENLEEKKLGWGSV